MWQFSSRVMAARRRAQPIAHGATRSYGKPKPPFAGPAKVLDYVGRYTHRISISNNRLLSLDNGQVSFRWKDYRDQRQDHDVTGR